MEGKELASHRHQPVRFLGVHESCGANNRTASEAGAPGVGWVTCSLIRFRQRYDNSLNIFTVNENMEGCRIFVKSLLPRLAGNINITTHPALPPIAL